MASNAVGLGAGIIVTDDLKLEIDGQTTFGDDNTGLQAMARATNCF
jgi:hypothetical protein